MQSLLAWPVWAEGRFGGIMGSKYGPGRGWARRRFLGKREMPMSNFVLSCESTADRTVEFFRARDIQYICFTYEVDGQTHQDDLYQSMAPHEFFDSIAAGAMPKTSQVSAGGYEAFWEPFLKEGKDVLHVTLSSGISGTYNSACLAAEQLRAKYPERTVRVIDSLAASSGFGLLMEYMADLRDSGATLDEVADWAEANKLTVHHWFFSTDLTSYKRGGRISATSAFLGTMLKICPLMNVDYRGRLIPREKIRTKKRAVAEMVKTCMEHIEGGAGYSGKICMSHSDCREDAQAVADALVEKMPQLAGKIEINDIGTVIGSHTGPGTVALFFIGDKRVD